MPSNVKNPLDFTVTVTSVSTVEQKWMKLKTHSWKSPETK